MPFIGVIPDNGRFLYCMPWDVVLSDYTCCGIQFAEGMRGGGGDMVWEGDRLKLRL